MARVYCDIGKFNRDITLNVEEASDKGTYAPYWESIKELVELIQDGDESEIVVLEVYKLAVNSVETYARKFKADGVTESDMRSVLSQVETEVSRLTTTSDKTELLKNSVIARLSAAGAAIDNAYRGG